MSYDVLVVALLDPRHPGPYVTLSGLIRPYKALLGSVAVAVAVADTFRMGGDHEGYKAL